MKKILFIALALFLFTACDAKEAIMSDNDNLNAVIVVNEIENSASAEELEADAEMVEESERIDDQAKEENASINIDYSKIRPDETGEIMIIMYHNLGEKNTDYGRTVESFKADLKRLYDMGFRTISMSDYITGKIDVPAGCTPVVLTFDDGHISNFKYTDEMEIDPECVVGIMEAFASEYPEFGKNAIFYLNYGNAFGQKEYIEDKLEFLLDNGYEIGNHSYGHEDLSSLNADGIQRALGKNAALYSEINSRISMNSLALPFGKRPSDEGLRKYLQAGEYEGFEYKNETILLVGWKPTFPIYHKGLNSSAIHRVQSGDKEMQLTWWLDEYDKNPQKRFISDGIPDRISVPKLNESLVDTSKIGELELFVYEP